MVLKTFLRKGLRIPNLPNDDPAIVAPVPALLLRSCACGIMNWSVVDDQQTFIGNVTDYVCSSFTMIVMTVSQPHLDLAYQTLDGNSAYHSPLPF